jgi:hypothetical protein
MAVMTQAEFLSPPTPENEQRQQSTIQKLATIVGITKEDFYDYLLVGLLDNEEAIHKMLEKMGKLNEEEKLPLV